MSDIGLSNNGLDEQHLKIKEIIELKYKIIMQI